MGIIALVLIEVRIMDNTIVNKPGSPTECTMTFCAPHLVTSADLEYSRSTTRARLRFLFNQFGTLDVFLFASVRVRLSVSDGFQTLAASMEFTEVTFVLA